MLEIPDWLQSQANSWIEDPAIASVILFGSRVKGYATEQSDWDVAVVCKGRNRVDVEYGQDSIGHNVQLAVLSFEEIAESTHLRGSIGYELAVDGQILAGVQLPKTRKKIIMSEADLTIHLMHAIRSIARCIPYLADLHVATDAEKPIGEKSDDVACQWSCSGAERVAKALCVLLGIRYEYTHSVGKLAEQVPDEWQAKVLAMDGFTTEGHTNVYFFERTESADKIIERIHHTLDLLVEILPKCLGSLSTDYIRKLQEQPELATMTYGRLKHITDGEAGRVDPIFEQLADRMLEVLDVVKSYRST